MLEVLEEFALAEDNDFYIADKSSGKATTITKAENNDLKILTRRACAHCNHRFSWWNNIPILGWVAQQGKCSKCNSATPIRNPIIELVTILLSVFIAWHFGPSLQCALAIVVTWLLIALSTIDFEHHLLPDSLTLPLVWIGLLASLVPVFAETHSAVIGAAVGYTSLWLINYVVLIATGREVIGYGDLKLLAGMGAVLGWQQLPLILIVFSVIAIIVSSSLLVVFKKSRALAIPVGPYIASAAWVAMIFGDAITSQYFGIAT